MKEIWKPIIIEGLDYMGLYEVSNKGNVKTLSRLIKNRHGTYSLRKEKVRSAPLNNQGYPRVALRKNKRYYTYLVSRLVATAFLGAIKKGFVVHHKDRNPLNNQATNLDIVTYRENLSIERTEKSGLPVGVYLSGKKYGSRVSFNKNRIALNLGSYNTIEQASKAYQIAVELIDNPNFFTDRHIIKMAIKDYRSGLGLKQVRTNR